MRTLTFEGFLKSYVYELSNSKTTRLSILTRELPNNPRLREPLFLYAIQTDKYHILNHILESDPELDALYKDTLDDKLIHKLNTADQDLGIEYIKVWRSYLAKRDKSNNDKRLKELILQKVSVLKAAHSISNYKIYTDLKLNHGNINAWLKDGDCGKVSLETARKVLAYLIQFEESRSIRK